MDRTLKAISLLLSYPTRELQGAMPEIGRVLASDSRLTAAARRGLRPLVDSLRDDDIYDLEEKYVMLFDRSRTLSLNLFEHVHGESRDRGGAMVSLIETYRDGGFEPNTSELPDHLPVLLEFLSTRPFAEVQDTLADAAHIFEALCERLARRESQYALCSPLFYSWQASRRTGIPWPSCWSSPRWTPTTWKRWMRSGKRAKCSLVPIPMRAVPKCAICCRAWMNPKILRPVPKPA